MPNTEQIMARFFLILFLIFQVCVRKGEDGSQLWLKYEAVSASMADILNNIAANNWL